MGPWAGLTIGLTLAVWGATLPSPLVVLMGVLSTAVSFVWVWDKPCPQPQTGSYLTPELESTVTVSGWDCDEFGHVYEMGNPRCLACEHETVDID